jgi:HSP20 family molecular chaperone IbpA
MEGMMNDLMSESLAGPGALRSLGNANYKIEWLEDAAGRTLAITPDDPREQLDINVADGLITLKGRHEQKTPNGVTYSNFTNSFSVPADCDPSKVKIDQKNGRILVLFPYLTARAPKPRRDERRPLPPSSSDVAI